MMDDRLPLDFSMLIEDDLLRSTLSLPPIEQMIPGEPLDQTIIKAYTESKKREAQLVIARPDTQLSSLCADLSQQLPDDKLYLLDTISDTRFGAGIPNYEA